MKNEEYTNDSDMKLRHKCKRYESHTGNLAKLLKILNQVRVSKPNVIINTDSQKSALCKQKTWVISENQKNKHIIIIFFHF